MVVDDMQPITDGRTYIQNYSGDVFHAFFQFHPHWLILVACLKRNYFCWMPWR